MAMTYEPPKPSIWNLLQG